MPVDPANFELLRTLEHRPVADDWVPMEFKLLKTDGDDHFRLQADLPWLNEHSLVLRRRAFDIFAPLVGTDAELLPLECGDAELWLLHVYRVVDAFDESHSKLTRFPSSGGIMEIDVATFDPTRLEGFRFFLIPEFLRGSIWVTDDVVDSAAKAGLTGTSFEVSTKGHSLSPRELYEAFMAAERVTLADAD